MLVLTRKQDQVINIGDSIRIKIVDIGNGFVKIGIDAPRDMPVYRAELYDKLKQANIEASKSDISRFSEIFDTKELFKK
jgi:carbon storage regulator